ncbi:MAG: peptidase [Sandaracinus sp.]|nr:peptidase [Sandaracinus sp.]
MRAESIRTYKVLHTWVGIVSGMGLFIAFFAGALTMFEEPITRWATPPGSAPMVPLAETEALVVDTLAARPDAARDFTVHLEPTEAEPGRLTWHVRPEGAGEHAETGGEHYYATRDASGALVVEEHHPATVGSVIDTLHRVVGLPVDGDPTRAVMGILAILYALALFSGVVIIVPSLVRDLFALRTGKNLKRMWMDAHNAVGVLSLPFHVVIACTAVTFAYHDVIYLAQDALVHEGELATAFRPPPPPEGTPRERDPAELLSPAAIVAVVQETAPSFAIESLQYIGVTGPRAMVRVWGKDPAAISPRAPGGFAVVDPYAGRVVNTAFMPGAQSPPNLVVSSFFALHMGAFGGALIRWVYFVLGLAGAWLFYTGNLLWVESRRRKARGAGQPDQPRAVRAMAAATVGVCVGSVAGLAGAIAASKLFAGALDPLLAYYGVFFVALGWAFAVGGARASVHLLGLAALLAFAIPLGSLVGWLAPGSGLWAHPATWGVDLGALALGGAFVAMARATARRARDGAPDSVWALPARGPAPAEVAQ